MSNPLQKAIGAFRQGISKPLAGVAVVVSRGLLSNGDLNGVTNTTATVGLTQTEDIYEGSFVVTVRLRDYMIDRTEYIVDGSAVEPQEGDVISQLIDGAEVRFQVTPSANGRPFEETERGGRSIFRVHTKEIGEAS